VGMVKPTKCCLFTQINCYVIYNSILKVVDNNWLLVVEALIDLKVSPDKKSPDAEEKI
jgi:hypothetical protein